MALLLLLALNAAGAASQDAFNALRTLRYQGCGGHPGLRDSLRLNVELNSAAAQWSRGANLKAAITRSGYREDRSAALHLSGTDQGLRTVLANNLCAALTDPMMADAGIFERGSDLWIVLAAPFGAPVPAAADNVAAQVLRRVNAARAAARHCGGIGMPAAPQLRLNDRLNNAAMAHAQDMLRYDYFEHAGHDGSTPEQRVAEAGYSYRLVGENIASGPETPQEVVQGWLTSPAHCQNLMDARFTDMGLAYAASRSGEPRIFWVQEFAAAR
ncbi:MAG TPA: CAP domain-containing protein [Steroidobacteraceae bacterium]